MNYQSAVEKLGNRDSRKIGNNTYLQKRENGTISVKLHNTDVVTFAENGDITLDSGGWKTVTTKARMNDYCPGRIYSNKGVWFYNSNGNWQDGIPYADGMTIHAGSKSLNLFHATLCDNLD